MKHTMTARSRPHADRLINRQEPAPGANAWSSGTTVRAFEATAVVSLFGRENKDGIICRAPSMVLQQCSLTRRLSVDG